jgi:hypothetical protein
MANAAPEWQARNLERKQAFGGGLTTRGVCWAAFGLDQPCKDNSRRKALLPIYLKSI